MLALVLNIFFASVFTLCIKWVQQRRREDVFTVGAINYIVAGLMSLPECVGNQPETISLSAVWTGALMGGCYFIAYFFVARAITHVGAASTTGIAVLSILVPIVCGVAIWDERPNIVQVLGVVLALTSLTLIGSNPQDADSSGKSDDLLGAEGVSMSEPPKRDKDDRKVIVFVLVTFFALAGLSRLAQEAFKHVSTPDQRPIFLISAFALASIPSVAMLIYRRRPILPVEVAIGVLMGASNILQSHYILKALEVFDGFIVFPVVSAGSLMFTTVVATRLMGERLSGRSRSGIVLAVAALFLLNYLPTT